MQQNNRSTPHTAQATRARDARCRQQAVSLDAVNGCGRSVAAANDRFNSTAGANVVSTAEATVSMTAHQHAPGGAATGARCWTIEQEQPLVV
jgi:hypothetical protein